MVQATRFFIFGLIFLVCSGFSLKKNDAVVKQGDVIYTFEGGRMQCLSEKDSEGKLFILIKGLDEKTEVKFKKMDRKNPKKMVLVVTMFVKEDTDICAGWINSQEVSLVIDPKLVDKTSLVGKEIYSVGNISILQ